MPQNKFEKIHIRPFMNYKGIKCAVEGLARGGFVINELYPH